MDNQQNNWIICCTWNQESIKKMITFCRTWKWQDFPYLNIHTALAFLSFYPFFCLVLWWRWTTQLLDTIHLSSGRTRCLSAGKNIWIIVLFHLENQCITCRDNLEADEVRESTLKSRRRQPDGLQTLEELFVKARHYPPLFLVGFISSLPQLAWDKRLSCCCCSISSDRLTLSCAQ
jgi:hypothetical protein